MLDTVITTHGMWSLVGILYLSGLLIAGLYNVYCVPRSIREMPGRGNEDMVFVATTIFERLFVYTSMWIVIVPLNVIIYCIQLIRKFALRKSVYTPPEEHTNNNLCEPSTVEFDNLVSPRSKKVITSTDVKYLYNLTNVDMKRIRKSKSKYPLSIKIPNTEITKITEDSCIEVDDPDFLCIELKENRDWVFVYPNVVRFKPRVFRSMYEGSVLRVRVSV